ncbi:MAG: hypothetical protein M1531_09170 [Chloroflexi bacterium]|nr:hypothetical protein [Chloroflexota bacterium]
MTEQRERRLAGEYCAQRLVQAQVVIQGCPLGPIPPEIEARAEVALARRMARPWRPECDILAVWPDGIEVIEAKIFKLVDGAAKLLLYASLVPTTPELQRYLPRPVRMRLICPWVSPGVEQFAERSGVIVERFSPAWIQDYVEAQHNYWTKGYREARAERQRRIQELGLG